MNKFESIIITNPDIPSTVLDKEYKNFVKLISNNSGKVVNEENWGLRDLSYKISNYKKAFYKFFQIELDGSKLHEIKKSLSQNENIIRHIFIKVNEHQELPTKLNDEKK